MFQTNACNCRFPVMIWVFLLRSSSKEQGRMGLGIARGYREGCILSNSLVAVPSSPVSPSSPPSYFPAFSSTPSFSYAHAKVRVYLHILARKMPASHWDTGYHLAAQMLKID